MKKITVSAPGKLMLFGEHAVVYGHPCIVTAVNQRIKLTAEIISTPEFQLDAPDVHIAHYTKSMSDLGKGNIPKEVGFVEIAAKNILTSYGSSRNGGLKITTSADFSSLFGFGSSAAVTVCMVKAVSLLFDLQFNNKELFDLAYKTVLDIQAKGSGFDVASAIYGGTLYFVTGGKNIELLAVDSLPLIVGYTGIKADTVTLMKEVQERFVGKEEKLLELYKDMSSIVTNAKKEIEKNNWQELGILMKKNQLLLHTLGVSTTKLDDMMSASLEAGAHGAKLSGAGGGDCMIALGNEERKYAIECAIENAGGTIMHVSPNAEGVRIEI